jgi:CRISPR-associated exonuclease Cas4
MCIEEMLEIAVPAGALYYGKKKRRLEIVFDEKLRATTCETATALHALVSSGQTPKPKYSRRCDRCSFVDLCLPKTVGRKKKVSAYMQRLTGEK